MTSLLGWIIIAVVFASTSIGLLYPCYRLGRSSFPDSRKIRWIYGTAAAVFSIALWFLLPLLVHQFFGRRGS
jgi:hypothetical protein